MAPATEQEQFKFLISCIRYSDNGKVNFEEVAKECDIVSKGAAAKRYERMMKFHGIHQSQTTPGESSKATPSSAKGKTASPNMNSKKRKASQAAEPAPSDDDEEEVPNVKPEGSGSKIKAEKPNKKVKTEMVKEEAKSVKTEDADKKAAAPIPQLDGADDASLYNDFLSFGGMLDTGLVGSAGEHLEPLKIENVGKETPDSQESILTAD